MIFMSDFWSLKVFDENMHRVKPGAIQELGLSRAHYSAVDSPARGLRVDEDFFCRLFLVQTETGETKSDSDVKIDVCTLKSRIWLGEAERPELCDQLAETWQRCLWSQFLNSYGRGVQKPPKTTCPRLILCPRKAILDGSIVYGLIEI